MYIDCCTFEIMDPCLQIELVTRYRVHPGIIRLIHRATITACVHQGRTEEFGERGVQYEFDEGAGQEMMVP